MVRLLTLLAAFNMLSFSDVIAEECAFAPVPEDKLVGVLRARKVILRSSDPVAIAFQSQLERDDDGGPNAYHVGYTGIGADPGLDHICNGGSVMEFKEGRLVDKYGDGGSIGKLDGIDPTTTWSRSALCKQDYINLRDAGFPACGPDTLCMLWYGIASIPRKCGFESAYGGADLDRCGVPIRQSSSVGKQRPYYLTTTALKRRDASSSTTKQSDYANASIVPFVVLPGGLTLPDGMKWKVGDIALVVWKSNVVAAIVGDVGPRLKLGEGSRALLRELRDGKSSATIDKDGPVTTILMPGATSAASANWPIDTKVLEKDGATMLVKLGGRRGIKACADFNLVD
ncbi:glycoside hydrolase family 75 protein [Bradyrhizobium sp. SZCCHNR1039]|uniref:glycoside hydrolase family 75 protein n=1 Tax=Bradyrhizobium sp. SZCCHNR1039 TaxID=3057350 RepID=UPI0029162BC7|nr:glycoside hydrolase family 75 protein [Bradyrhizobium sp. SZCCHNR1039]